MGILVPIFCHTLWAYSCYKLLVVELLNYCVCTLLKFGRHCQIAFQKVCTSLHFYQQYECCFSIPSPTMNVIKLNVCWSNRWKVVSFHFYLVVGEVEHLLYQWFSTGGDFAYQGTFCNVWRCFWFYIWERVWGENSAGRLLNFCNALDQALSPNTSSARVGKLYHSLSSPLLVYYL